MTRRQRHGGRLRALAAALIAIAATAGAAALTPSAARSAGLGQLDSELSQTQAREGSLSASLAALQSEISSLTQQIVLVQQREALVQAALAADETRLASARVAVRRERARAALLRARLARAQRILAGQLVSSYESPRPTLVSVILDARGFDQLLEQVQFLGDAEHEQRTLIVLTEGAKRAAIAATRQLTALEDHDRLVTAQTVTEAAALAGMNSLLGSREAALADARAAQETALAAARARGAELEQAIAKVEAEQAAAARAAALEEQSAYAGGTALEASAGWAIPYAIVLCESGGQNLPPNGAGASGYYQIIPSTWRLFGGSGPAAYLAPKADQDAVASRIWDGGAGASNWVCAAIVGFR
jgi:septal ring factor EnvC (AmiA/AmiB activator)